MASAPSNPHKHPFVRWNSGAMAYEETAVYDQETGAKKLVWPIDQKEIVATSDGRYALTPPAPKPEPAPVLASEPEPEAPEETAPEPQRRRGPGRPPKNQES